MSDRLAVDLGGYTDLPRGKIANVVTYLEMHRPPPRPQERRADLALARLTGREIERYLSLYRTLGERWLWWSRLELARPVLAAMLDSADVEAFALVRQGEDIGLLELDFRDVACAELAFFGLIEAMIGTGAGRWLMDRAIERAWARSPSRFFVHTCTFDHPAAIDFYRRSGFTPYKFAVEIVDDPRLTGVLPRSAGPHVPLIDPTSD